MAIEEGAGGGGKKPRWSTKEYTPKDDIVHAQGRYQYKALCRINEPKSLSYYVGDVTCVRCLRWTSQMAETRLRKKRGCDHEFNCAGPCCKCRKCGLEKWG